MEYSFSPYQEATLWVILLFTTGVGLIFGIIISMIVVSESEPRNEGRNFTITMGVVMVIAYTIGLIGYAHRNVYENIRVTGILVNQYAQQEYTSGKSKRLIDQAYVVYRVPEGEVSFRRETGVVYPKEALLFMNKKR